MQRHKKKYAKGDMGDNSFVFTGKEHKLNLKATNLVMFAHIADGIDDDTGFIIYAGMITATGSSIVFMMKTLLQLPKKLKVKMQ
jgi:hypothetical protein